MSNSWSNGSDTADDALEALLTFRALACSEPRYTLEWASSEELLRLSDSRRGTVAEELVQRRIAAAD